MKFKALIDGVHFDPKKGTVKIALVATLHDVSLDELATIGPKDESIRVALESEQTRIEASPLTPYGRALEPDSREERELGAPITLSEEEAVKFKEAADRLEECDEEGDEVEGADKEA